MEEKKRLWCRRRWTRASTRWPCARWQAHASLVQTWMPPASLSAAAPLVCTLPATSSLFTLTSAKRAGELAGRIAARLKGRAPAFVRVCLPLTREPRKGGRRPAGRRIPLSVPFGDSSPSRGALEEGAGLPPGGGTQGASPPGRRESLRGEASWKFARRAN